MREGTKKSDLTRWLGVRSILRQAIVKGRLLKKQAEAENAANQDITADQIPTFLEMTSSQIELN